MTIEPDLASAVVAACRMFPNDPILITYGNTPTHIDAALKYRKRRPNAKAAFLLLDNASLVPADSDRVDAAFDAVIPFATISGGRFSYATIWKTLVARPGNRRDVWIGYHNNPPFRVFQHPEMESCTVRFDRIYEGLASVTEAQFPARWFWRELRTKGRRVQAIGNLVANQLLRRRLNIHDAVEATRPERIIVENPRKQGVMFLDQDFEYHWPEIAPQITAIRNEFIQTLVDQGVPVLYRPHPKQRRFETEHRYAGATVKPPIHDGPLSAETAGDFLMVSFATSAALEIGREGDWLLLDRLLPRHVQLGRRRSFYGGILFPTTMKQALDEILTRWADQS